MHKINLDELKQYIIENPKAKIYFGCDSTRYKKKGVWMARYLVVVIVYQKNKNKIFGEISHEVDYDKNPKKPQLRMMNEVAKLSEVVLSLSEIIKDREFEIHLDINKDKAHGSSVALSQAIGYIKGVHGKTPIVKNSGKHPWAASSVADYFLRR